jgi:hypothetical protein
VGGRFFVISLVQVVLLECVIWGKVLSPIQICNAPKKLLEEFDKKHRAIQEQRTIQA